METKHINQKDMNDLLLKKIFEKIKNKQGIKLRNKYKAKISEEEYLESKFKDYVYTYHQFSMLIKKYKLRYKRHVSEINSFYSKAIYKNTFKIFNKILDKHIGKALSTIPERYKDEASVFGESNYRLCIEYYSGVNLQKHKLLQPGQETTEKKMLFSHLRCIARIDEDFITSDFEKLNSLYMKYINSNFKSINDYLISILLMEIDFLHNFNIWAEELKKIFHITNYYSKEIEKIQKILYMIAKKYDYLKYDYKSTAAYLTKDMHNLILDKIKNGDIYINGSKHLLAIVENIEMSYEDRKEIIYKSCNTCCGVIFGERKLSDYNLPFQHILTKEDYAYMINSIIFIGNNAIKVK